MAERVTFTAYLVYSMFLTAFAYPVAAHWYVPSVRPLSTYTLRIRTRTASGKLLAL